MIEYGTVEVGGIPYVCPIRSVTVSRDRTVLNVTQWDQNMRIYGPYSTLMSDATFENYHRFRSESRILTGRAGGGAIVLFEAWGLVGAEEGI